MKKRLVVFTGAGISAESGIKTFRDSDGLWEEFNISDVATASAWKKNPSLVIDFYNARRKQIREAQPNAAHVSLAQLESKFDIQIITQNIDDLHERAGSSKVLHLHGEILKSRSTLDPSLIYPVTEKGISLGDRCERGSQLRPHIVFFDELVVEINRAVQLVNSAEIFVTIGTSLSVAPAAGLLDLASEDIPKFLVDPGVFNLGYTPNFTHIQEKATSGIHTLEMELEKLA